MVPQNRARVWHRLDRRLITTAPATAGNRHEMTKKHGNAGNQNAAHPVKPDTHLHIRVSAAELDAYDRAAERAGMKRSAWVRIACAEKIERDK